MRAIWIVPVMASILILGMVGISQFLPASAFSDGTVIDEQKISVPL